MKNKNDILYKLKNNKTGFSTPENYFSEFENSLQETRQRKESGFVSPENYFDKIENKILLQTINNSKKLTGFKTPSNYFENLEQSILGRISSNKPIKIVKLLSNNYLKIVGLSIAASLLLFFSLNKFESNNQLFDLNNIEISEIENWMDEDLITFSSYDIVDTFGDLNLNGLDNYSEDEIIDYLNEEHIDNLILEN